MVIKHASNKYITLEDVRVSYSPKDDTIHITSADFDVQKDGFHISLNQGTRTERTLRSILENEGLIRKPYRSEEAVRIEPAPEGKGEVITIASMKTALGKSSLAVTLASYLKANTDLKIVVVDADFRDGSLRYRGSSLDSSKTSITDYLKYNVSYGTPLARFAHRTDAGWDALYAPAKARDADKLTPENVRNILSMLQDIYDVVIIDMGTNLYDPVQAEILDVSNSVFLLTQAFTEEAAHYKLQDNAKLIDYFLDSPSKGALRTKMNIISTYRDDGEALIHAVSDLPVIGVWNSNYFLDEEYGKALRNLSVLTDYMKQPNFVVRSFHQQIGKKVVEALEQK